MIRRPKLFAAAFAAVLAAGCGTDSSCPTGSADVSSLPSSCNLAANQTVTMYVRLCPHCYETSPSCEADTSQAASGQIFLDTRWDVCEDNKDCGISECTLDTVACTFSVPAGSYTVITPDNKQSDLTVAAGGSTTCGSASALTSAALEYTPYE